MYPNGTTFHDPKKAFYGYTLWSPLPTMQEGADADWQYPGHSYLIDMEGNVVHQWELPYPTMYAQLLPNGHLLAGLRTTKGGDGRPGLRSNAQGGAQGILYEADWYGNEVFRHEDLAMHHDFRKIADAGTPTLHGSHSAKKCSGLSVGGRPVLTGKQCGPMSYVK